MMRIYRPHQTIGLALVISLIMTGSSQGQADERENRFPDLAEQEAAGEWITEKALRADIKFLADDLLEGRGPGTRGDELAQRYIVSQFEQMGLEPAASNGGWIQKVPLVGVTTKPPQTITFQEGREDLTLQNYQDYIRCIAEQSTCVAKS